MKTIELTVSDGSPIAVNLAAIAYAQASDDGTLIVFIGGQDVLAREPYHEVIEQIVRQGSSQSHE